MRHALFQVPYSLPSSVSSKSFTCHSYENCRGVPQLFPLWNLPSKKATSTPATSIPCSSACPPSPVPPSPNDYPPFFSDLCALFCAFLHQHKSQLLYFQAVPHSSTKNERSRQPLQPRAQFSTRPSPSGSREHGSRTQSHESRTTSRRVAALPSECYDLVFHDSC